MSFIHQGRTITKVAVIGSGQIGPDIALYFAKVLAPDGVKVVVVDVVQAALDGGKQKLEKKVSRGVESKAFTAEQQQQLLSALSWTTNYQDIQGAELVVEAATENQELKGKIFAQVETLAAKTAVLCSNSSHLEPEVIFNSVKDQSRTAVVHYFFPAERNLVVEVVPGEQTAPATTDWLLSFYEAIGKVPIRVRSRYGYALDPVFEGLFLACALIAEAGTATTKQIDVVCKDTFGMGIGSFTAMNLTGGNPITAIGLDNYTTRIHSWFRTPKSLKEKVAQKANWDVPGRGETVEVPDALRKQIADTLMGAYFGLCGEILDADLVTLADFDMGLELALDMKPAFTLMNQVGTKKALELVQAYSRQHPGFPVPKCIATHGKDNRPFEIPTVLQRDVERVRVLTIRRPKVLNALDQGVFDELARKFTAADRDPAVDAVVLTGHGRKAFVSGADVKFLARIQSAAEGEATSRASQLALDQIQAAKKPSVCALNGLAFGGGLELALACETRIARAGQAVLCATPEVNLGIIPGAGGTQRLPRLIGIERAAQMVRTGKPISSAQARQYGLIQEEVPGDLLTRAMGLARELAQGAKPRRGLRPDPLPQMPASLPPLDLGHLSRKVDEIVCKAILKGAAMKLADGLLFEAKCFGEVCGTEDFRIGVRNFLENGPRTKAAFAHK